MAGGFDSIEVEEREQREQEQQRLKQEKYNEVSKKELEKILQFIGWATYFEKGCERYDEWLERVKDKAERELEDIYGYGGIR